MKYLIASLMCLTLLSCMDDRRAGGPGLRVEVGALTLTDIVEARYTLTVRNGLGEVVWSKGPLSSIQYGDGRGSLTYIGTCDALENPHTVELLIDSLSDSGGVLTSPLDYVNPTRLPDGTPSPLVATNIMCRENGDTPVVFDVTIARRANQGFFDIAVELDDIFCSAKLDCRRSFLHKPDGERGDTAILGFACTGGAADSTWMYLSDLVLSCPANPSIPGQTDLVHVLPTANVTPGQHPGVAPGIFAWALYAGREFPEQTDLEKCYRNIAIGLDTTALAGRTCTVSAIGTASQTPLPLGTPASSGHQMPTTGAYPYIQWQVQVLGPDGTLCQNHALDDVARPGVATRYVTGTPPLVALPPLTASMMCGEPDPVSCQTSRRYGDITATATDAGFRLSASDGSVADATFTLPAGYSLGESCCAPDCCDGAATAWCQMGGTFGAISATPTATGFRLSAGDASVADATFALPAGYHLSGSCCTPGCCAAPTVTCQQGGDFGTVSVIGTATGFDLHATEGGLAPASFTLPDGYTIGTDCCTPGCCR